MLVEIVQGTYILTALLIQSSFLEGLDQGRQDYVVLCPLMSVGHLNTEQLDKPGSLSGICHRHTMSNKNQIWTRDLSYHIRKT